MTMLKWGYVLLGNNMLKPHVDADLVFIADSNAQLTT